jgi:serine/threonine protein kinase/tetratricopeptide (TPR) repeat protein
MHTGDVIAERFEIEREVATGGMGRIYRARDHQQGGYVAIKLLTQQSPRLRSRLLREAAILAEIHHPGIVRYIAHGPLDGDMVYLVMEWLEGEDLGRFLGRRPHSSFTSNGTGSGSSASFDGNALLDGTTTDTMMLDARSGRSTAGGARVEPLTVSEAVALGRRLTSAVAELHRRGIVHRDIKPSNLFLAGGALDQVKLLDFGTAYQYGRADHLTRRGAIVGTPHYMAPEQARAGGIITPATDVWAVGCVLYRCLTGSRPFEGNDVVAVLTRILLEPPVPILVLRPDVPLPLAEVIMQALEKEPTARAPDADTVLSALEQLGDTERLARSQRTAPRAMSPALTSAESRVTCMLFADFAPFEQSEDDNLAQIAQPLGGQIQTLADGTVLVTIPHVRLPGDQAARAARVALALQCEYPELRMVLATGRTMESRANEVAMRIDVDAAVQAMHSAAAGRIQLDATTAAALGSRFMVVRENGRSYLGPERDHEAARTLLGRPTRWVGRRSELAALVATFDECGEERVARAVLVTAPAGMGKSRLREELVRTLHQRGEDFLLITASGDPIAAGSPLVMLAPALRRLAGILDGEDPRIARRKLRTRISESLSGDTLGRVLPYLGELIGVPWSNEESGPHMVRASPAIIDERMREAWQIFLRAECARRPVLIVLDDLHWGDLPSVSYIDTALEALRDRPLMVLALARPEVRTLFPQLWTRRDMLDMSLAPLSARAAAFLVRDALGDRVDDETIDRIVRRAGGNAFFLEELIRGVAESGSGEVPETVLGMVQARLDALGPEAKRILRAASVFGEVFWRGGVEALLGPGGTFDVGSWLDELAARELVQRAAHTHLAGQREYSFRHTLVREAAYAMLTDDDRRLGHALAGDWLEQSDEQDHFVLGEHFLRGGEPDRAFPHFLHAAERALEEGSQEIALQRAQRAVDAGVRGPLLGQLRAIQAAAAYESYRYTDSVRLGREAMAAVPAGSVTWFRAMGHAIAAAFMDDDDAAAGVLCATLLSAASEPGAEAEQIICLCRTANQMLLRGLGEQLTPFLAHVTELEAVMPASDVRIQGPVRSIWALVAGQRGDLGTAAELLEQAIDAFERAGDMPGAVLQRNMLAAVEIEIGRFDRALSLADQNLTLLRAAKSRPGHHFARITAAWCMAQQPKRRGEARETIESGIAGYRVLKQPQMEAHGLVRLAALALLDERWEDAEEAAARAVVCAKSWPSVLSWALAVHARALLSLGRVDEALADARRATELSEKLGGLLYGGAQPPLALALALYASGDLEAARVAARAAEAEMARRSGSLRDVAARRSFDAVPEHREIAGLGQKWAASEAAAPDATAAQGERLG